MDSPTRTSLDSMGVGDADWLGSFLREFASMSEEERDAAIDTLPPGARDALLALAEAREATAEADLIEVLDAGHGGLHKLYQVAQPDDLFAVINLAIREHPNLVVAALFAAVVVHRGWDEREPAAIVALREQWDWRVHEQTTAARKREDEGPGRGA
jgi:hypothetical protein